MCNLAVQAVRCALIGGSDARIIKGDDETALLRLRREKRGKAEPKDLSANLIVQLGFARISTPSTMPKLPDQTGRPNDAFPENPRSLIAHEVCELRG